VGWGEAKTSVDWSLEALGLHAAVDAGGAVLVEVVVAIRRSATPLVLGIYRDEVRSPKRITDSRLVHR